MSKKRPLAAAWLSLAAICIIWGTTYIGMKYALRHFPPYLLVGIRQTTAGLLLLTAAWVSGKILWPGRRYVAIQAAIGLFTITGGNGFMTWGMQYISAGLASIIGALTPIIVALASLFWGEGERMRRIEIIGIMLGFVGLAIVFQEGWQDLLKPEYQMGILGCFSACTCWSLGTVMSKRYNSHHLSPLLNAGMQITAGGVGGLILSFLLDQTHEIHHAWEGWIAVGYLILIGSALAFTLYMYVLRHLSATVSSIYTYVNPIVAVLLGWAMLGEHMTVEEWIGMAVTLFGVWLVNRSTSGKDADEDIPAVEA